MMKYIFEQNWKLRLPLLNSIFIWLRLILINNSEDVAVLSFTIFVQIIWRSVLLLRLRVILLVIKIIIEILKRFISWKIIIKIVLWSLRIKTSHLLFLIILELSSIWRLFLIAFILVKIIPRIYLLLSLILKFSYIILLFLFVKIFFFLKFLSVVRDWLNMTFWAILILVLSVKFTFWLVPSWTIFKPVWITHLILIFCRKLN
jgi:hypothetical protein